MKPLHRLNPLLGMLALSALLSACGRPEDSAGEKLDEAIAKTEQAGAELKADAKQLSQDAQQAVDQAARESSQALADAAITTRINAALAADSRLKASQIDVDTQQGVVTLKGTAPDPTALRHATALAQVVDGVRAVDNRLVVVGKS